MSYTVSAATEQAVRASISTPVLPNVLTVACISTQLSLILKSTEAKLIANGWQSGINSDVFLAACIPATLATPNTSPFLSSCLSKASNVSVLIKTFPDAVALLFVSSLLPTSTICAFPFSSTWLNSSLLPLKASPFLSTYLRHASSRAYEIDIPNSMTFTFS